MNFAFVFFNPCSGLQEVMELKPKEVRLFVWADPTGIKKLNWDYAQNTGELDLLKVICI